MLFNSIKKYYNHVERNKITKQKININVVSKIVVLDLFFGGENLMLLLIFTNGKNESLVLPNRNNESRSTPEIPSPKYNKSPF